MKDEEDQEHNYFIRGLDLAMKVDGWKMKPLSLAAGMGETAVKDIFRNASAPRITTAYAIASAMGRTIDSIIALGMTGSEATAALIPPDEDLNRLLVNVWDIEASAGDGSLVPHDEALAGRMAFPPGYLADITSTSSDQLQIITVKGRSMQPTLHDGDVVMIDRTKRHLGNDGIYVIRIDDALHIKRISRSSTKGMIRILSDNHLEHGEFERPMAEVEALGRVIWAGKRM